MAEVEAAKADGRWDEAYAGQRTATIPDDLLTFLREIASYYLAPLGEVVRLALPPVDRKAAAAVAEPTLFGDEKKRGLSARTRLRRSGTAPSRSARTSSPAWSSAYSPPAQTNWVTSSRI